jgi:3-methyladenine DNA glycosylase/8-oxoguanine DNA glycosylase
VISELGYYELHVIGVEKKRADALKRVASHAPRLEPLATLPAVELRARLEAIPGIGAWTSAEVSRVVLGDADAVSVGDHNLKDLVSWALASEPRGSDARMLELLEPFAGHRGRVCVLIEGSGITAPKYGPRQRIEPTAQR